MKLRAVFMVLLASLFTSQLTLAEQPAEKHKSLTMNQDPQLLMERFNSYPANRRAEAIETAQKALDQLDARIETLSKKLAEKKAKRNEKANRKAQDELKGLQKARATLGERFAAMKESSAEKWGKVKDRFSQGFHKLNQRWKNADKAADQEH